MLISVSRDIILKSHANLTRYHTEIMMTFASESRTVSLTSPCRWHLQDTIVISRSQFYDSTRSQKSSKLLLINIRASRWRDITDRFKSDLRRCDSQETGVRERSAQDHDRGRSRCNLLFHWKKSVKFSIPRPILLCS